MLAQLAEEFNIKTVGALITDNAANMVVAARKEGFLHHSCYARTLQLAIEDALKLPAIVKALGHARSLVTHFSHSATAVEALKKQQRQGTNTTTLMLIQDVATRWNFQFYMMRCLLKLRVPVLILSDRSDLNPPDSAWKTLEELCPLLEPFEKATELLTKEDTPTISQIVIIVQQLLRTIQAKSTDQTTTVIRSFKEKISSGLISRFGLDANGAPKDENFDKPVVLATFLDPRYKSLKNFSTKIKERLVGYVSDLLVEAPKAE